MLRLRATFHGNNVVCSKREDCTFIGTKQLVKSGNANIRYYVAAHERVVYSNVADDQIVFIPRGTTMLYRTEDLSIKEKRYIGGYSGIQFAMIINRRLFVIVKYGSKLSLLLGKNDNILYTFSCDRAIPYFAFVDVNRLILYLYAGRGRIRAFSMIGAMDHFDDIQIPLESSTHNIDDRIKSATVDPTGNFMVLYTIDERRYRLAVYDPSMQPITSHTLVITRAEPRSVRPGISRIAKIESIAHHPSRNEVFVTTNMNHIAMLNTFSWSPESYTTLPTEMKLLIFTFVMQALHHPFNTPIELILLIIQCLFDTPLTIDITPTRTQKCIITDAASMIERYY